jgi:hypothetical protein
MTLNFQRAVVQQELKNKLSHWQQKDVQAGYTKGLVTNPSIPNFGIERSSEGYYYLSDNLVSYCDLKNGKVYRIRKNYKANDWTCYQALHAKSVELGTFRLDAPLYKEEIGIVNEIWEYAELQSPGQNYGRNFNDDVFNWPEMTNGLTPNPNITDEFKNSVKDYFKEFVDQSFVIASEARKVAEQNNCGMPLDIAYPFNRYKDDAGYFWSDFDQYSWETSKDEFVLNANTIFGQAMLFAKVCGVLDDTRIAECVEYARNKWTLI